MKNCDKGIEFFHNLIKTNRFRNHIASISLADESRSSSKNQVSEALLQFYKDLLGSNSSCARLAKDIVLEGNILEADQANDLIRAITDVEIKSAIFSIREDKAPGLDGFTSCCNVRTLGP